METTSQIPKQIKRCKPATPQKSKLNIQKHNTLNAPKHVQRNTFHQSLKKQKSN